MVIFVLGIMLVPTISTSALMDNYNITLVDETSNELSIPDHIGIEIPETEEGLPILGIIMWALVAVAIMTALIVIFANMGGVNSIDKSVRRNRYRKKPIKRSKYSKYKE